MLFRSNHELSGNVPGYREGLQKMYGTMYLDKIENLNSEVGQPNWGIDQIKEAIKIAAQLCRHYETTKIHYSAVHTRIDERDKANKFLKLY